MRTKIVEGKQMRIAMIGSRGIPAHYGGIERAIEEISIRLAKKGHKIIVYSRFSRKNEETTLNPNIKLIILPTLNTKYLETIIHVFLSTLNTLVKKFDIIHFHALGPSIFSFLPRVFGKKSVVTIHGWDWAHGKWGSFAKWFLKKCEYCASYFPSHTIVVSKALQIYYQNKYSKPVSFIPSGVDNVNNMQPNRIKAFGLDKDNYILFVGRIIPGKGCEYLIEAFKKLNTSLKLVFAGASSYANAYFEQLKKMGNENVLFLGHVPKDILEELYSNCYFYVLPSETEGCSLSLLEAMAYGNCIISSDIPANIEVIGNCGYTFENKDSEDLARVMKHLVQDKSLVIDIKEKTKENILTKNSWDKIANEIESLYLSLLSD